MKCIQNQTTGEIRRVTDKKALILVTNGKGNWKYIPKQVWKDQVRGPVKRTDKVGLELAAKAAKGEKVKRLKKSNRKKKARKAEMRRAA
jgi:hypothetical protein